MAARLPLLFGNAAAAGEPVAVMLLHHAGQAVGAAAFLADEQVEAQGGQCAFLVIAHDGVGAVFILFVEFVPSGEARFGQSLFQTAWILLYAGEGFGQQL